MVHTSPHTRGRFLQATQRLKICSKWQFTPYYTPIFENSLAKCRVRVFMCLTHCVKRGYECSLKTSKIWQNSLSAISRERCHIRCQSVSSLIWSRAWAFGWYQNRWPSWPWAVLYGPLWLLIGGFFALNGRVLILPGRTGWMWLILWFTFCGLPARPPPARPRLWRYSRVMLPHDSENATKRRNISRKLVYPLTGSSIHFDARYVGVSQILVLSIRPISRQ